MVSPLLDEDWMITLLKAPTTAGDGPDRIQAGAAQALIDLFDRKVTREVFLESATPCLALYGQCAKLWVLRNIKQVYEEGALDPSAFAKAETGLTELILRQSEELVNLVKRLQMCPNDEDRVH